MLRDEDERAIEDLFQRLRNVERNSAPRDVDAERLIHQRLNESPTSAYFMAQTIIVQEAALREAQQRIEALEAQQGQGGFLGGIFGNDRPASPAAPTAPRRGPWGQAGDEGDRTQSRRSGAGGGFLAGAAQTALGVTGGLLLGSAIAGMFSSDAQAGEAQAPAEPDDAGAEDGGGDWGGDFDIGGDF